MAINHLVVEFPEYISEKTGPGDTFAKWQGFGARHCGFGIHSQPLWAHWQFHGPAPKNPGDEKRIAQLILAVWRRGQDQPGNGNWKKWIKAGGDQEKFVKSMMTFAKLYGIKLTLNKKARIFPFEFPNFFQPLSMSYPRYLGDWRRFNNILEDGYLLYYGGLMVWSRDDNFFLGLQDHSIGWTIPGCPTDTESLEDALVKISKLAERDFRTYQANPNPSNQVHLEISVQIILNDFINSVKSTY